MTCRMGAFVGLLLLPAMLLSGILIGAVSIGCYLIASRYMRKEHHGLVALAIAVFAAVAWFSSIEPIGCAIGTHFVEHFNCD